MIFPYLISGLVCEGGNRTHLSYNYWVGSYDANKKEIKSFYEIKYNESSDDIDTIITGLCPPKYCCQSLDGCDYLTEYNNFYAINTSLTYTWQIWYGQNDDDNTRNVSGYLTPSGSFYPFGYFDEETNEWIEWNGDNDKGYLNENGKFISIGPSKLCATGRDVSVPLCGACLPGWAGM